MNKPLSLRGHKKMKTIQWTKSGAMANLITLTSGYKPCEGHDKKGKFGCGKLVRMAIGTPLGTTLKINFPLIQDILDEPKQLSLIDEIEKIPRIEPKPIWMNHFINCPDRNRFRGLSKK